MSQNWNNRSQKMFKPFVATFNDLPLEGNALNDKRTVLSEPAVYNWNGEAWVKEKDLELGKKNKFLFG